MLCLQMQVIAAIEEQSKYPIFSTEDIVEVMGYELGEKKKLVAHWKVKNVEEGHCIVTI